MKQDVITNLKVNNNEIRVMRVNNEEYISLTDLARYKNAIEPSDVIKKWMSNYDSIEFLGIWETISNEEFNSAEFSRIKNESSKKSFTMTPSLWCKQTNSKGIIYSKGKYSIGTFAHSDIAFEFASWIDNIFKLYLIKEFQRLKKSESYQNKIEWQANRTLAKVNYLVHTNAISEHIVPTLTDKQLRFVYAEEADVLNVALFGMTAKEWRDNNPTLSQTGNIRDYTDLLHLVILNNLENINATLIKMNISQSDRLIQLNELARKQLELLYNNKSIKELERIQDKQITIK